MKGKHVIKLSWIAGLGIFWYFPVMSQDEVPCLIFTGNSTTTECLDLTKLNRITFEEDAMVISSSSDADQQDIKLLYSEYNRLEIGDAVPTGSTKVDFIESNGNIQLAYQPDSKSLILESSSGEQYRIGIFSLKGTLIATSNMRGGESLSIGSLGAGTYIVLATNGESKISLKIIIN